MLADDFNVSILKTSSQETKKLLVEAKRLQNVFIQNSSSYLTQEVMKLQEREIRLNFQQNQAHTILASVFNALQDIEGFVNYLQKNEKIGANYKLRDLNERKIIRLMDHLNTLKVQVEDQSKSFESSLGEETIRLLEILKAEASTNRSNFEYKYIKNIEKRIKKQHELDDLRLKKIQRESRIKRLNEDISNGHDLLQLLEEEIKACEKKLAERIKFEEKNGSGKNSCGLDAMIRELDEKKYIDYDADLRPKEEKIKKLMTLLDDTIGSKSIEQQELRKKFHFVFVVNRNETMNAGKLQEAENCINAVIEDRKGEKDLYSLILYHHTVKVMRSKQKMIDFVQLPEKFAENDEDSLNKVFAEVFEQIKTSKYYEYAPIVILLTDGMRETGHLCFKKIKPIDSKIIKQACESMSKINVFFKQFGFCFFISGISPYDQQGLRKLANSGNGGKTFLEGCSENHDFLNNCKFKKILPEAFRDLTNSSANKLLNDPPARTNEIKEHIEILKDSISLSKKFIDERYDKLKTELQKKADILQNNYKHENSIRESYAENLKSLQEERDQWKTKILAFEEEKKSLTMTLPLEHDFKMLEEVIEQELRKEKEDSQNKIKEEFIIINPYNVNISQSIEAFEKVWDALRRKSSSLVLVLHNLLIKTGQVLSKLKKQTSPIYSSLMEHYMSSLEPEARYTDEAIIMVKIAQICLNVKSDEKILNCLFKLIPPRVLCDLEEDVPFLEQRITEEASTFYLTAESKMKMNEKSMDDLLFKMDAEIDSVKKAALREEKEVLRKQKLDIQAELEVIYKEGVDVLEEKLIMCFRDLRRKLLEVKETLPTNEKHSLDQSMITHCIEVQRLIKMFSEVECNI